MKKKNRLISLILVGVAIALTIVVLFLGFAKSITYTAKDPFTSNYWMTTFDYIFVKNDAKTWSEIIPGGLKHNGGLIAAFAMLFAILIDLGVMITVKVLNKDSKVLTIILGTVAGALLITSGILWLLSKSFFVSEFSSDDAKKYLADNIKLGAGAISAGTISLISAFTVLLGCVVYPGIQANKNTKKAKRR